MNTNPATLCRSKAICVLNTASAGPRFAEAIKHLAGKRLIDVQPKIGTRVLPFNDWNLLDREVLAWRLNAQFDSKIVEDIFEMRLCFEPRACYLRRAAAPPRTTA